MKKYLSVAMLILIVGSVHAMNNDKLEHDEELVADILVVTKNLLPAHSDIFWIGLRDAGHSMTFIKEISTRSNYVWEVVAQILYPPAKELVAVLKNQTQSGELSQMLKNELKEKFLFDQFDNLDDIVQQSK